MEVTAAERTNTYTGAQSLAEMINSYIDAKSTNITAIAKEIGYSRVTVSRYLSGKYDSDPTGIETKLTEFLAGQTWEPVDLPQSPELGQKRGQKPRFYESRDAKAVLGVCQSCQEYQEMGIIIGRSGYGKTYALKEYTKLPKVAYIECDVTMSPRDLLKELERALGIPPRYGTNHDRASSIVDFLMANPGYLLIVDEADKLMNKYTYSKMDVLRSIFDRSSGRDDYATCGLVVAGEPKLEMQIETYLDQYANRTIFGTELEGLSEAETEEYLSGYEIEPDAMTELKRRAVNNRTGCFRLLDRTMRNVRRIMENRPGEVITLSTLEQASSMMML